MAKRVKYLVQIVPHLEERYGADRTRAIMQRALTRYDELLEENKDEPKAYYMHTRDRIYPAIAMFDAMTSEDIDRTEAADFLTNYYTWRAGSMARIVKTAFKIPGLYKAVPKIFSAISKKSFARRRALPPRACICRRTRCALTWCTAPTTTRACATGAPRSC